MHNLKTQIVSLITPLEFSSKLDRRSLLNTLEMARKAFNFCSQIRFKKKMGMVEMHKACYKLVRKKFPKLKSIFVVTSQNECLSSYKTIKSNKHILKKPIEKRRLSCSFNKHVIRYNFKLKTFFITVNGRQRIQVNPYLYQRFQKYIETYKFGDPKIFVRNNIIYISLPFKIPIEVPQSNKLALGVDLGIRRFAATSEGNIYIDKDFNKQKRKLRYLKRVLNSKKHRSCSAKTKLKKLKYKERNRNRNFVHHLSNQILQTKANVIVLENLNNKKLKSKTHKLQNKNHISQVSFGLLKEFLIYKAALLGKEVVCVNPAFTSQIDSTTGKIEGKRAGRRFTSSSGEIYDADINAAVNIAKRSNHPYLYGNILAGQAIINWPIVNRNKIYRPLTRVQIDKSPIANYLILRDNG